MDSTHMAERSVGYLDEFAVTHSVRHAEFRFKVHQGNIGPPVRTHYKCDDVPLLTCSSLLEMQRKMNELVRLKHGFGELTVWFGNKKLKAIVVASRFLRDETEAFGSQLVGAPDPSSLPPLTAVVE